MKVEKVRLGFATNSSSSHSVIIAGSARGTMTHDMEDPEFGWEVFIQKTPEEKMVYLIAQFCVSLRREIGEPLTRAACRDLFGIEIDPNNFGVDHQSCLSVPYDMDGHPAIDFWRDLANSLSSDANVHILGGSDNGDDGGGTKSKRWEFLTFLREEREGDLIARNDSPGRWTLFNKRNGAKIRVAFAGDTPIVKDAPLVVEGCNGNSPELIDFKITDYCAYGCEYCYQDSGQEGKHASHDDIERAIYWMKQAEVLEVALGGGDPIEHPEFPRILKSIREEGIVPNFSTRSWAWVKNKKIADAVMKYAGAIGFSVDSHWQLNSIYKAYNYLQMEYGSMMPGYCDGKRIPRMVVHYIPEAHEMKNLLEIVKCMNDNGNWEDVLLLLGWKQCGRAKDMKPPHDMTKWRDELKGKSLPTIAADTCFANRYQETLKNVPAILYETEEGRHSMYMDMVSGKYASCSYADPKDMHDIGDRYRADIQEMFYRVRRP